MYFIASSFLACPLAGHLAGLAEMYVADEHFAKNINRHGDGTAQFIRDAIKAYCT